MGTHGNNVFGALGKPNGNMGKFWEHALLARPLGNTNWESKPLVEGQQCNGQFTAILGTKKTEGGGAAQRLLSWVDLGNSKIKQYHIDMKGDDPTQQPS